MELPLTLNAEALLPVTISDPDTVPDPVNGKAPIPVNPDPSPINEPLAVPLTNKLPVNVVLPLTLSAFPPLPVTISDPDNAWDPVALSCPDVPELPDEPEVPLVPEVPDDPDEPLEPEEPDEPLEPDDPEEPYSPVKFTFQLLVVPEPPTIVTFTTKLVPL